MKKLILLSLLSFTLLASGDTTKETQENSAQDDRPLMDKIDDDLLKAQKKVKKKLSEIDDDMTRASKDFNKNVFGTKKSKKKQGAKPSPTPVAEGN